jgi:peptidyl-prolyl cis-trans isomerase SurA
MSFSRSFLFASAGALAGVALMVLCVSAPAAAHTVDEVVASVDNNPITLSDVRAFAAATGTGLPAQGVTSSPNFKPVLKQVIEQKLLEQEVKKYESKIDDSQVNAYIEQIEQARGISNQQLQQALAQNGLTYEAFRKQIRLELEKTLMINDEVRSKLTVSDAQAKAYYDTHRSDFTVTKERYKLAQILIAVPDNASPKQLAAARAKAEMVRKLALSGQDFATLAREYSDDASKSQGGELGYFAPGEIMNQILDAVKPLKPGQISRIVRTQYGFHILKLEEHEVPGPRPFADVKTEIRNRLLDEMTNQQVRQWVDTQLVKQHYVETLY